MDDSASPSEPESHTDDLEDSKEYLEYKRQCKAQYKAKLQRKKEELRKLRERTEQRPMASKAESTKRPASDIATDDEAEEQRKVHEEYTKNLREIIVQRLLKDAKMKEIVEAQRKAKGEADQEDGKRGRPKRFAMIDERLEEVETKILHATTLLKDTIAKRTSYKRKVVYMRDYRRYHQRMRYWKKEKKALEEIKRTGDRVVEIKSPKRRLTEHDDAMSQQNHNNDNGSPQPDVETIIDGYMDDLPSEERPELVFLSNGNDLGMPILAYDVMPTNMPFEILKPIEPAKPFEIPKPIEPIVELPSVSP